MTAIDQQIEDLRNKAAEVAQLKEDTFQQTADISVMALGLLLQKLNDGLNTLFEGFADNKKDDKEISKNLQSTITEAITKAIATFTKIKQDINFAPNISVDISPLQNVASDILKQNKLIYSLVEKISSNNGKGKSDELYRLVLLMVDKNNNFLDKVTQTDYTKELVAINDSLKNKTTEWSVEVTKRDQVRGWFEKAVIKSENGK